MLHIDILFPSRANFSSQTILFRILSTDLLTLKPFASDLEYMLPEINFIMVNFTYKKDSVRPGVVPEGAGGVSVGR